MNASRGRDWRDAVRSWFDGRDLKELELELEKDSAWSAGAGRAGLEVHCARGVLLVTVEGDVEDHVLCAGETFSTRRRGRLAVWALETARLRVKRRSASVGTQVEGDGVSEGRRKLPLGSSG